MFLKMVLNRLVSGGNFTIGETHVIHATMTYYLALKTIAANDDKLVKFPAGGPDALRRGVFEAAPAFDFHLYYRHAPVGQYFRLYDGIACEYLVFDSPRLSETDLKRAWDAILMMDRVERKALARLAGRDMTPEIAKDYPRIPAELTQLNG